MNKFQGTIFFFPFSVFSFKTFKIVLQLTKKKRKRKKKKNFRAEITANESVFKIQGLMVL